LNDNSTKAIKTQVQLIKDGGYGFAEVVDAYMEEAPLVAEWDKLTTAPNVVVVPFFIADGLHSYQDIPVLLGMAEDEGKAASQSDVFRHNPYELRGRQIYYSSAIGTEALMADVILDQVAEYDLRHQAKQLESEFTSPQAQWLAGLISEDGLVIGEVCITPHDSGYRLTHREDAGRRELLESRGAAAAREQAWLDEAGEFRALKSAPTLRRGWSVTVSSKEELKLALDFLYPAAVGMAYAKTKGTLQPVPLREYLNRQTGMYRFAKNITDTQACEIVARICGGHQTCARRIVWLVREGLPLDGPAAPKLTASHGPVPLLCMEACPHMVSEARKVARQNHEASLAVPASPG
jgi:sirohydrochlorin cobaltochelatase